jgi:hypothetical protein
LFVLLSFVLDVDRGLVACEDHDIQLRLYIFEKTHIQYNTQVYSQQTKDDDDEKR